MKIIGVKEIPNCMGERNRLNVNLCMSCTMKKEVMYACNMCIYTHWQNSALNVAHIVVTNLDMSYIRWAEKYG